MRLIELTIKNFRGFGPAVPPIDLSSDLVLMYGPNGHGKTSVAEAVEWLFYGTTKRRQRGEQFSRAEFAGTYANVHGKLPVEVSLRAQRTRSSAYAQAWQQRQLPDLYRRIACGL